MTYKNTFKQGITPEEHYGSEARSKGIPMDSAYGRAKDMGLPRERGVPMMDAGSDKILPTACSRTTKAGNPCKAAPIKGQNSCIGHSRSK